MKTILIIEDNNDIRDNLTEYLELEGFKIMGAPNGQEGIELAREHKPDLIICDVLMPKMDGHGVLRLLLETANTCEIPLIFCSSFFEKFDIEEALKNGADDYVTKPFEMEVLLKKVKELTKSGSKRKKLS